MANAVLGEQGRGVASPSPTGSQEKVILRSGASAWKAAVCQVVTGSMPVGLLVLEIDPWLIAGFAPFSPSAALDGLAIPGPQAFTGSVAVRRTLAVGLHRSASCGLRQLQQFRLRIGDLAVERNNVTEPALKVEVSLPSRRWCMLARQRSQQDIGSAPYRTDRHIGALLVGVDVGSCTQRNRQAWLPSYQFQSPACRPRLFRFSARLPGWLRCAKRCRSRRWQFR